MSQINPATIQNLSMVTHTQSYMWLDWRKHRIASETRGSIIAIKIDEKQDVYMLVRSQNDNED